MAKIYVGNLPFTATEADVRTLFSQHGTVESVSLPTDRETGRPRGFGIFHDERPRFRELLGCLSMRSARCGEFLLQAFEPRLATNDLPARVVQFRRGGRQTLVELHTACGEFFAVTQ